MNPRSAAAVLAVLVLGCASRAPVQPVTFGTPERWGPGLVQVSDKSARVSLTDSAYVILLRIYPGAGVDTYLPDSAHAGRLAPGTHTLAAPLRSQRRSTRSQVDLGTDTNEQRCRSSMRAFYATNRNLTPAQVERAAEYVCRRSNLRAVGSYYDEVHDGYLLLIVSDVPTPGTLRDALQWMIVEPDSIGATVPALAEVLVGMRTERWAAYSLAPRR